MMNKNTKATTDDSSSSPSSSSSSQVIKEMGIARNRIHDLIENLDHISKVTYLQN